MTWLWILGGWATVTLLCFVPLLGAGVHARDERVRGNAWDEH